jgi:hypothetical protein
MPRPRTRRRAESVPTRTWQRWYLPSAGANINNIKTDQTPLGNGRRPDLRDDRFNPDSRSRPRAATTTAPDSTSSTTTPALSSSSHATTPDMTARRQPSTTSLAKYARAGSPDPSVRNLDFCNAFWGLADAGVDVLFARMRGAARTMEELRNFWKERSVAIPSGSCTYHHALIHLSLSLERLSRTSTQRSLRSSPNLL